MITADYMTEKLPPPSAAKLFVDQTVIPAAIDIAASGEALLERMSIAVQRMPLTALALSMGLGALVMMLAAPTGTARTRRKPV